MFKHRRVVKLLAAFLLPLAMMAAACSSDSDEKSANGGSDSKTISIAYIPWDEDIAVTYLWKQVLEDNGYKVNTEQLDVAPTFQGIADGNVDLFFDTWLPTTHADYWEEFGDKVEDLGVWYDNAILTIAVPDYMKVESIADLASVADQVNGEIIGIEPGAGLTRVTKEEAIPGYKLSDSLKLVTSSTTAMLTALDKAVANEDPIVVTLWRPHWAYSAYPIRDLKDPEGLMGGAEGIHVIGRKGFTADHKEVADAVSKFSLDDDQLASLEAEIFGDDPSNPDIEGGVKRWMKDNRDFVDAMFSSKSDS